MSESNICRLCLDICKHYRSLYNKNGFGTEVYSLIIKYFDSTILNMELGTHLTSVCLKCWYNLLNFNTFAQSVASAQAKLNLNELQNESDVIIKLDENSMIDTTEPTNEEEFICIPETESHNVLHHREFSIEFISEDEKVSTNDCSDQISDDLRFLIEPSMNDTVKDDVSRPITLPDLNVVDIHQDASFCSDEEKLQNSIEIITLNANDNRPRSNVHFKNHQNPNEFKCEICGNVYATIRILSDHLLTQHSGLKLKRSLQCPKCPFRYASEDKYKLHLAKHDICEYGCTQCGKVFASDNRRLLHERLTHGINRHCNDCGKSFRDNNDFTKHLLEHNGNNDADGSLHVCPACGQTAETASEMRTHVATHAKMDSLVCSHCPKTFQYRSSLRTHLRNKHSVQMPYRRKKYQNPLKTYIPTENI